MELKINSGLPCPKREGRPLSPLTVALKAMEVGDSVYCPDELVKQPHTYSQYIQRTSEKRFSQRREGDGFRIWRTA
jgi:hypothetical protein